MNQATDQVGVQTIQLCLFIRFVLLIFPAMELGLSERLLIDDDQLRRRIDHNIHFIVTNCPKRITKLLPI